MPLKSAFVLWSERSVSLGHPFMLFLVAIISNALLLLDLVMDDYNGEYMSPNEVHP